MVVLNVLIRGYHDARIISLVVNLCTLTDVKLEKVRAS